MKKETAAQAYNRRAYTSPVVLPPTRDWRPLKVAKHPEQARIDAYRDLRSLKP